MKSSCLLVKQTAIFPFHMLVLVSKILSKVTPHPKYTLSVKAVLLEGSILKIHWCWDFRIVVSICVVQHWHFITNPDAIVENFPNGTLWRYSPRHADSSGSDAHRFIRCKAIVHIFMLFQVPLQYKMTSSYQPVFLIHTDQSPSFQHSFIRSHNSFL